MGKSQRNKGYRGEYNLVKLFKEAGLDAQRVPLSGASEFKKGDVVVQGRTGEVKVRGSGFKKIYEWLGANDFLAIKADRREYLIVLRVDDFVNLLKGVK